MRLTALIAFLLALHSPVARAEWTPKCNLQTFLVSLVYEKKQGPLAKSIKFDFNDPLLTRPRSSWGSSRVVKKLDHPFEDLNLMHFNHPYMNVYQRSLAEKNPELIRILSDMDRLQRNPFEFEKQFSKTNHFAPELEDYKSFYKSRALLFESGAKEYINVVRNLDADLANRMDASFHMRAETTCAQIDDAAEIKQVRNIGDSMNARFSGYMAELHGAASLPDVHQAGVTLMQIPKIAPTLDRRLREVAKDIESNPKAFDELSKKYPKVFKSSRFHDSQTPYQKLEKVKKWIFSKEIDVVRELNGKSRWVEIKRSKNILTLEKFKSFDSGLNVRTRSYYDQIIEDKQIIEFLGMSDKIELEYLSIGGMTPELKTFLNGEGIKVIDAR